jgi:hypothetical protein
MNIDLDAQIAAVNREIAMRKRVYPRWIETGRMKQAEADHQIAAMQAVLATLMRTRANAPIRP